MPPDFSTPFGRRALRRLKKESIAWLTSVDPHGRPRPRPVWFHWNGEDLLICSQPRTGKVRQLARNPHVSVHFNTDVHGDDVVVLLGEARVSEGPLEPKRRSAYLRKYRQGIADLEMTPEAFLAAYSVAIYFRPTILRGW